jgi:PAS domain S-box-containing protein
MNKSKESERTKRAKKELLFRRKELVQSLSQMESSGEEIDLILSGERLDDFFDISPSLMLITNPKGDVIKINKSCLAILGYTQKELLKIDLWSLVHPDDLAKTTEVVKSQLQGNSIANFINRYKRKDGSYRTLEWQTTTVKDGFTYAYANDITEQNEALEELQFQSLEKQKRAEELLIANKELQFQSLEKQKRADELLIANKELQFQSLEKQKRADELIIIQDDLDILREKEILANQLSVANKELEQFSYLASHDLQEPLRTISNYIKVFEEDYSENLDETAHKYLSSVNMAANRMSQLIQSLLEYSVFGRNRKLISVDCAQLVGNVIRDLNQLMKTSGALVEVGDMPTLNLYEIEIHMLFQNLITNAIKFQDKNRKPKIKIRAEEIDDVWTFSISDNGIGIESKYFERIFQIFQFLNPRSSFEGTGIGLAYCKKIVELHSGKIWVKSTLGKGTTFYFTLDKPRL